MAFKMKYNKGSFPFKKFDMDKPSNTGGDPHKDIKSRLMEYEHITDDKSNRAKQLQKEFKKLGSDAPKVGDHPYKKSSAPFNKDDKKRINKSTTTVNEKGEQRGFKKEGKTLKRTDAGQDQQITKSFSKGSKKFSPRFHGLSDKRITEIKDKERAKEKKKFNKRGAMEGNLGQEQWSEKVTKAKKSGDTTKLRSKKKMHQIENEGNEDKTKSKRLPRYGL